MKEVQEGTGEQEQPRQDAVEVGAMFGEQKKADDDQESQKDQSVVRKPQFRPLMSFVVAHHQIPLISPMLVIRLAS